MAEEAKSRIDELNDTLHSRSRYEDPKDVRSQVESVEPPPVEGKWQSPELDEMLEYERRSPETHPLMKKIFTIAVVFFVITVLLAGYVFFGGANFISSKNVEIDVVGPTSVSAGEVLELGVTITNKNNADLELANLSIQYPQDTRDAEDVSKSFSYSREELGVIKAGREVTRTTRARIFGSEGDVEQVKFSVEYRVKGSNATFFKDKVYEIAIGETPLSIKVESDDSVNSGDSFSTRIIVSNNSTELTKNVMLRGEYPYGFVFDSSSPQTVANDNVWSLGDLSPGEKKTVTISGKLLGENQEERTFRFYIGVSDAGGLGSNFRTVIASTQNTVTIARPSVALAVRFNGETGTNYTAPAAGTINTSVRFQNNLAEKLLNPRLEVKITGPSLDKSSVSLQDGGFYDSANGRLTWAVKSFSEESVLEPGDEGEVSFIFASIPQVAPTTQGREIILDFTFSGVPQGSTNQRPITITEKRVVRISSEVSLSSKALYSRGPFANHGPVPPKVDSETTYTIVITAGNTRGDISNPQVTMKLGPGVSWLGKSTEGEDISYSHTNSVVTWDLGLLKAGSGFTGSNREASFQVALKPSISQVGSVPVLVDNISFLGTDVLTTSQVTVTNTAVTTRLISDPKFVQGDDVVVR